MEEFNFSEDEIKVQLELLGYHDVPLPRLEEFKKDLEQLVKHEKSKNSSIFSTETSSDTGSEISMTNHHRLPFDAANQRPDSHTYNKTTADHIRYGKENHQENGYRDAKLTSVKGSIPSGERSESGVPSYSMYSDEDQAKADARLRPDVPQDVSITSTTSSERKIMKRKVLRKKDGLAQVFDESVTESESDDVDSLVERLRNLPLDYGRPSTAPCRKPAQTYTRPSTSAEPEAPYALPRDYEGPTALIRPMSTAPHTRNIKKSDPVSRFQHYNRSWGSQRAPGEKAHKGIRWGVREHMLYHDPVVEKKQHKVFLANSYVIPSDKKRKNLRWQIRNDLAQGVKPPSMFD